MTRRICIAIAVLLLGAQLLGGMPPRGRADFELELGQRWFALAGAAILTAGVMFLLSLPYAGLPPALPALAGFLLAAAVLAATRWVPPALARVSGALCASGMALLGFAGLRLGFIGPTPVFEPEGAVEFGLLGAVADGVEGSVVSL